MYKSKPQSAVSYGWPHIGHILQHCLLWKRDAASPSVFFSLLSTCTTIWKASPLRVKEGYWYHGRVGKAGMGQGMGRVVGWVVGWGLANRKTRRPDFLRATASASINVLLTFTLSSNYPNFNGHRPLLRPSNYAFIKIWIDVISACWKLWYQNTSTQK